MRTQFRISLIILALFTLLTGLAYPLAITGISQLVFSYQANGSLIKRDGEVIGSTLIGQSFTDPAYFWGRPSATQPFPYNGAASAGSNLGPTNPALVEAVQSRIRALRAADPGNNSPVPIDLVTASASGLDPHISIAAALYQIPRVARERRVNEADLISLVNKYTEGRQLGFLGEPRVNVLKLNLALDKAYSLKMNGIQ
jgi:K+-transporting ATPase ATPase C chain